MCSVIHVFLLPSEERTHGGPEHLNREVEVGRQCATVSHREVPTASSRAEIMNSTAMRLYGISFILHCFPTGSL